MMKGVQKVFGEDGAGYAQNIYLHEMFKCKYIMYFKNKW